jgi:flagellar biosynthesis GTPase FlhF
MNNDKDLLEDNFNNSIEDVEQMLKPLCEFKASNTLKQNVMEKARQEIHPTRIIRMWPWLAAACVIGFLIIFLKPPKKAIEQAPKEEQIVAKAETTKAVEGKQGDSTPEQIDTNIETTIQPHAESISPKHRKTRTTAQRSQQKNLEEAIEEPVQMSEETRMELLMASLNEEMPQMEEINTEEAIRQIRIRGERLIGMYEENDN